jgi:hypothetical protein
MNATADTPPSADSETPDGPEPHVPPLWTWYSVERPLWGTGLEIENPVVAWWRLAMESYAALWTAQAAAFGLSAPSRLGRDKAD